MRRTSRILITNQHCYAFHGCLAEEARIGGHYRVDVSLEVDVTAAAAQDDLSLTVDYCDVRRIIDREMGLRSKLIEHVAGRIGSSLLKELPLIQSLTLTLTKIAPPMGGDVESVAVVMEFKR